MRFLSRIHLTRVGQTPTLRPGQMADTSRPSRCRQWRSAKYRNCKIFSTHRRIIRGTDEYGGREFERNFAKTTRNHRTNSSIKCLYPIKNFVPNRGSNVLILLFVCTSISPALINSPKMFLGAKSSGKDPIVWLKEILL